MSIKNEVKTEKKILTKLTGYKKEKIKLKRNK